jgi:hypothetical protein
VKFPTLRELLTAGFSELDPHRMKHMRGLLKGSVRLAEVASSCGRVSIYATRCQNSVKPKFAEYPFRNCLENRDGFRNRGSGGRKEGRKSPDRPPLLPKQHAREAYGYFPNSFSTHLGE